MTGPFTTNSRITVIESESCWTSPSSFGGKHVINHPDKGVMARIGTRPAWEDNLRSDQDFCSSGRKTRILCHRTSLCHQKRCVHKVPIVGTFVMPQY